MIFDTIENYNLYSGIGPEGFSAAFKFLRETDLNSLPVGRHELDGDNLYFLVQEYTTKSLEQAKWESHRRYIDIQYMVSGFERVGFANLHNMQLGDYLPEKDYQQMTGEGFSLNLSSGSFAIFFPDDAHMPGLVVSEPSPVKKVVIKVKIN